MKPYREKEVSMETLEEKIIKAMKEDIISRANTEALERERDALQQRINSLNETIANNRHPAGMQSKAEVICSEWFSKQFKKLAEEMEKNKENIISGCKFNRTSGYGVKFGGSEGE